MKSRANKYDRRAIAMVELVASVTSSVTGITVEELRSTACNHDITKARFIFADLCNSVVSPISIIAEYLSKNNSMIAYYKRAHNNYYEIYKDFREMSDKADEMLTESLIKINGTFGDVFQEEGEQVQC
jgi:hypothetical protein